MQTVTADNLITSYDVGHSPCAEVDLGEQFRIETHDRIPAIAATETLVDAFSDRFNPIYAVTGPIFVRGTRAGSVIRVDILDISLDDRGIICATPGRAGFGDKITTAHSKIVDIEGAEIVFSEGIRIPLNPHVGKLATTPPGEPVPTGSPGPHGGNMDNKHLTTGSAVFLPVFVDGALLSLGDLHAAMGDGESNSSGVEVAGTVTLCCRESEGLNIAQPLVMTASEIQMLGQGDTLEDACRMALDHMAGLVTEELEISYQDAAMLISIAGDLHICQIANPLVGVRVSLARELFRRSKVIRTF
jgi:amidase